MKVTCEICKENFEIEPEFNSLRYKRLIHQKDDHDLEVSPYLIHRYTIYFSENLYIVMGYYNHSPTFTSVGLYKKNHHGYERHMRNYKVTEDKSKMTFCQWAEFIKNELLLQ